MQVIVIWLPCWVDGGEPSALARARLAAAPAAMVMIVGSEAVPPDLLQECADRRTIRVDAPLHQMSGRRLADVRCTRDAPQLAWSLAVMSALLECQHTDQLGVIELPSSGALAYATLQERATTVAFEGVQILVRFDGLASIEAVRKGQSAELAALMLMDMERMCLEQCDHLLVDSAAIGDFLREFLPSARKRLSLHMMFAGVAESAPNPQGHVPPLACVVTEGPALRQCLRAMAGYLQQSEDPLSTITMVCEPTLLAEALQVVPLSLRARFVAVPLESLRLEAMRVVLPDRWTAGAAQARELAAQGHVLLVDASNPSLDISQTWRPQRTHLQFSNAAGLLDVLRESEHWRPDQRVRVEPVDVPPAPGRGAHLPALVSVVVPCFNMGRWLPQTLRNIEQILWKYVEVIVVDDGSTEAETVRLIEQLQGDASSSVRVVRLPFNQGLSAARNAGVALAKGEFTMCLDADDLVSPEFLSLAVRALQRFSDHDFVVPRCAYFTGDDVASNVGELKIGQGLPMVGAAFDSGLYANRFSTATCLARTSVLQSLGYDESLRSYEDWQLYRRALQLGSRFIVSNDIHFFYRQRPDSMIHDPAMRARHSRLYAEMVAGSALLGQVPEASVASFGALAAPPRIDGSSSGLLLGSVVEAMDEMHALRRSRIVGVAYRVSAILRRLRS